MATPGPVRQKIQARITRTKAVVKDAVKSVVAPIKREAAVAANSISQSTAKSDNTLGYVEKQATVSARKADRAKRRYENNVSNPNNPTFQGQGLPNKKRKAIAVISENLNTSLQGRDRRKLAKEYYADIKSKPQTDAQKEKRDSKLQSRAIIGPSGIGAGSKSGPSTGDMQNVCPRNATNGGTKGSCAPAKVSAKEVSAMPVKNSQASTIMNTKTRNLSLGSSKKK